MVKQNDQHPDLLEWLSTDEEIRGFIQLALLGSITRKVIHESNNQLTGILGYLTLAQKTTAIPDNLVTFIQRAIQCCESSQSINNTFLDFFHTGEKTTATTSELLTQVISFCQKTFGANCAIRVKGNESLPYINAPESQVKLIFLYLLLAAKNDISERGEIHIELAVGPAEDGSSRRLTAYIHPHRSVSHKKHRADSWESPSSSLLIKEMCFALAHQYAIQYGGEVHDENHPVKPSFYQVSLPIKRDRNDSPSTPVRTLPTKGDHQTTYRIVLLEDQPIIAEFIRSLLNHEGHWVEIYNNGDELAKVLPSINVSGIDLFMLDICVPGIDGIEVGSSIRNTDPNAKIVFYSALRNEKNVLEHFPLNDKTRFLQKPFRKEELFEMIQSVMAIKE